MTTEPLAGHIPVLQDEVLAAFTPQGSDRLLDGTLGLGGHTAAYLTAGGESTTTVGIDADEAALQGARQRLQQFGSRVTYVRGSYHQIKDFTTGGEILSPLFTHILLDLGVGSHQLSDADRGFSFSGQKSLVMRYGGHPLPPAHEEALNVLTQQLGTFPDVPDLLQHLSIQALAHVIRTYGEEKFALRIAQAIAGHGADIPQQLGERIRQAVPKGYEHGRIHPATRTFQALRLAVNRELEILEVALPDLVSVLVPKGKIAVIAFHSLEDRIVKRFFQQSAKGCICPPSAPICICGLKPTLTILTKRPITASEAEKSQNPRSRSAKMRVAQKI